jgi:2-polyprenyl-3-methyl-5-hydroxy-6-metoxy-1,4-benzoquinol methylase
MNSKELGKHYNKIAGWWTSQMKGSDYGMKYVQKAMSLTNKNAKLLDIGCGSNERIIDEALKNGFDIVGIDVSSEMIRIATKKHPDVTFIHDDFIEWRTSEYFDLIIAWDSVFHAPKHFQEKITKKMCSLLNEGGILLFTAGSEAGEVSGEMEGVSFEYGSIGYWEYLTILSEMKCKIVLMEEDQFPAGHMVFICKKKGE